MPNVQFYIANETFKRTEVLFGLSEEPLSYPVKHKLNNQILFSAIDLIKKIYTFESIGGVDPEDQLSLIELRNHAFWGVVNITNGRLNIFHFPQIIATYFQSFYAWIDNETYAEEYLPNQPVSCHVDKELEESLLEFSAMLNGFRKSFENPDLEEITVDQETEMPRDQLGILLTCLTNFYADIMINHELNSLQNPKFYAIYLQEDASDEQLHKIIEIQNSFAEDAQAAQTAFANFVSAQEDPESTYVVKDCPEYQLLFSTTPQSTMLH